MLRPKPQRPDREGRVNVEMPAQGLECCDRPEVARRRSVWLKCLRGGSNAATPRADRVARNGLSESRNSALGLDWRLGS